MPGKLLRIYLKLGRADTRLLILIREKKAKEDPDKLEQELASVIE
jgi:hypothetical protein